MNRRLFVGQFIAGFSLFSIPSSLTARSTSLRADALSTVDVFKNAMEWAKNGSLGSLQHITLSHVYSPERTSLPKLMAMVQKDIASINTLLGTDFVVADQALLRGESSAFGTYSTHSEKSGVKITWQGLARIGDEDRKPAVKLRIYGSKGIVQACPVSGEDHFIDWQGQTSELESQFSYATKRLGRRRFFTA